MVTCSALPFRRRRARRRTSSWTPVPPRGVSSPDLVGGRLWEDGILPALTDYIAIHNVGPAYARVGERISDAEDPE